MARSIAHFSHPAHELKFRDSYTLPRWCDMCRDKLPGYGHSCRRCGFDVHVECVTYPETLRSFAAHPRHDLTLACGDAPRLCNMCGDNIPAGVFSYLCAPCGGFAMHPRCSLQPQHALSEQWAPAEQPETQKSFFAHPWHDLSLAPAGGPSVCDMCRQDVPAGVFVYRCAPCGFHVHLKCSSIPQTVSSEHHPEHSLTAVPTVGKCAACGKPCYVWVYRCGPCKVDVHIACVQGVRPSRRSSDAGAVGGSDAGGRGEEKEGSSLSKIFKEAVAEVGVESLVTFMENL